jgi:hypothetical protein
MGCKIARSVIASISDKAIKTRATICQGLAMFMLPVSRIERCAKYQTHRFINHCPTHLPGRFWSVAEAIQAWAPAVSFVT